MEGWGNSFQTGSILDVSLLSHSLKLKVVYFQKCILICIINFQNISSIIHIVKKSVLFELIYNRRYSDNVSKIKDCGNMT
jgi:hypothetical protein